jgi:hypothetical protein
MPDDVNTRERGAPRLIEEDNVSALSSDSGGGRLLQSYAPLLIDDYQPLSLTTEELALIGACGP